MDFSRSKDVAMFFVTCQYAPVKETYATAVLYTVDLKGLIDHRKGDASFLPLGLGLHTWLLSGHVSRALIYALNAQKAKRWIADSLAENQQQGLQNAADTFGKNPRFSKLA